VLLISQKTVVLTLVIQNYSLIIGQIQHQIRVDINAINRRFIDKLLDCL